MLLSEERFRRPVSSYSRSRICVIIHGAQDWLDRKWKRIEENRRGGVLNAAGIGGAMAGTPGAAPRLAMLSLDHLVLAARRSNLQPSEGRPRNHYECVGTTVDS